MGYGFIGDRAKGSGASDGQCNAMGRETAAPYVGCDAVAQSRKPRDSAEDRPAPCVPFRKAFAGDVKIGERGQLLLRDREVCQKPFIPDQSMPVEKARPRGHGKGHGPLSEEFSLEIRSKADPLSHLPEEIGFVLCKPEQKGWPVGGMKTTARSVVNLNFIESAAKPFGFVVRSGIGIGDKGRERPALFVDPHEIADESTAHDSFDFTGKRSGFGYGLVDAIPHEPKKKVRVRLGCSLRLGFDLMGSSTLKAFDRSPETVKYHGSNHRGSDVDGQDQRPFGLSL